jgi:PEP-CTERM motif
MRMVPKTATGLQGVLYVAGAWIIQSKTILTMCFFLAASSSAAANIIYTVDLPSAGDVTVTGTITTDGTLGMLGTANFLNWDFTVSSHSLGVTKELTPANTTLTRFDGITATNVSLFILPPALIDVEGAGNLVVVTPAPPGGFEEGLRVFSTTFVTDSEEIGLPLSRVQLADNGVPAVPEPSTWVMLLIGFAAFSYAKITRRIITR